MSAVAFTRGELVASAQRVAEEVAGPHADEVDRDARFPTEAINAMRETRLLSALVPVEFGGSGATIEEVAQMTRAFGAHCSSAAFIFAMHHVQIAGLVRHGQTPLLNDFLCELAESQYLLGSATAEAGGGDIRMSACAVQRAGRQFTLKKQAPFISYGAYADAILTTARHSPESAPADQVLVLCRAPGLTLEQLSEWETLGFRGACSPGFSLTASGDVEQILTSPFSEIWAATMLPVAHVLWSSAWVGIASAAVERARHFVVAQARQYPGVTPFGANRLAELAAAHQELSELVNGLARRYNAMYDDPDRPAAMTFAIAMNNLMISASSMVVDIVGRALVVCGLAGYRSDTAHSMGRLLRDAYGAALMVDNDRVIADTAQMLLMSRDA